MMSQGSLVSVGSDYGLDAWDLIPNRVKDLSSILSVYTDCGVHPASYPVGTRGPLHGAGAWF